MYSAAASLTTKAHCPFAETATAQVPSTIGYSSVGCRNEGAEPVLEDEGDGALPPLLPAELDCAPAVTGEPVLDEVAGGPTGMLSSPTFQTVK